MERTLKLTIAYDGTRYAGWQTQTRRTDPAAALRLKPTIQGMLEQVLRQILQEPAIVVGSGRTDAGVHAMAQVAHLTTRSSLSPQRLLRSVNQLLPPEIAVTRIEEVNGSFHARFNATRKRYRYRIFTGPVVPPFIRPYVHHVPVSLNVALLRREASALQGEHDMRVFARVPNAGALGPTLRDTRRTITSIHILRRGQELHIEVEGTGFLHTMIRRIVGTLLEVGRGQLLPGSMAELLATGDRRLTGTTAPAKGLTLMNVTYDAAL